MTYTTRRFVFLHGPLLLVAGLVGYFPFCFALIAVLGVESIARR